MAKSIAIAGKGGIGKSTISALIIRALQQTDEKPILAIDADPDSNLATLLGITDSESVGELREDLLRDIKNFPAGMSKASYIEAGLHEIISESDGLDLITMGRGEGSGCYCYLNSLIRKFSDDLAPSYRWVVFDNEAGLEHLSRRTTQNVDALLVAVTENPLSLHSAKSIKDIVDLMGNRIRKTYAVTNMVKPRNIARIKEQLDEIGLELLVELPYDENLDQMVFENSSIVSTDGLAVWEHILTIVETVRRM
jgi:CO dehydrogenase maturation factor